MSWPNEITRNVANSSQELIRENFPHADKILPTSAPAVSMQKIGFADDMKTINCILDKSEAAHENEIQDPLCLVVTVGDEY